MQRAERMLLWLEAAVLAVLGMGMIELTLSGHYWQFLNPKFQPLTLAGGVGSLLASVALPFVSCRGRKSSLLAMAGFLALAGIALVGIRSPQPELSEYAINGFDPGPPPPEGANFGDPAGPGPSRLTLGGQEYVKMNVMELWLLSDDPDSSLPEKVVVLGQALPLPGRTDRFVVGRVSVSCCLADAMTVAFVVNGPLPEGVKQDDWVRVAGTLVPLDGKAPALGEVPSPGMGMTVVHEQHMLSADEIAVQRAPEMPFVFEIRGAEPYAY